MNREFTPESRVLRSLFACAAVLTTVAVVGSIDLLARHYDVAGQLTAGATPVTIAGNGR